MKVQSANGHTASLEVSYVKPGNAPLNVDYKSTLSKPMKLYVKSTGTVEVVFAGNNLTGENGAGADETEILNIEQADFHPYLIRKIVSGAGTTIPEADLKLWE